MSTSGTHRPRPAQLPGGHEAPDPAFHHARYDGLGQRILKQTGGAVTHYVYDAAGVLAAEYSTVPAASPCGTSVCYVTADHLGSTRLVTDAAGGVSKRYDYLPFGVELQAGTNGRTAGMGYGSGSDGFNPKFTGQMRDPETGLDYFNARYYSPAQGRFTSPDPGNAGASLGDPQTWNGYAYVNNNPVNLTDPTGEGIFGTVFGAIAGALTLNPWVGLAAAAVGNGIDAAIWGPSAVGVPGLTVGSLAGCGGPLGSCGGINQRPWSEKSPVGPRLQNPERFVFSFQDPICGDFYCDQNGRLLEALPAHMMNASDPLANAAVFSLAQSIAAPIFHFSTTVTASRWGRAGLEGGDWVMKGGATRWNYFWSGKWEPEWVGRTLGYRPNIPASFNSGASYRVPASSLRWPRGFGLDGYIKGLLGQRIYKP